MQGGRSALERGGASRGGGGAGPGSSGKCVRSQTSSLLLRLNFNKINALRLPSLLRDPNLTTPGQNFSFTSSKVPHRLQTPLLAAQRRDLRRRSFVNPQTVLCLTAPGQNFFFTSSKVPHRLQTPLLAAQRRDLRRRTFAFPQTVFACILFKTHPGSIPVAAQVLRWLNSCRGSTPVVDQLHCWLNFCRLSSESDVRFLPGFCLQSTPTDSAIFVPAAALLPTPAQPLSILLLILSDSRLVFTDRIQETSNAPPFHNSVRANGFLSYLAACSLHELKKRKLFRI